MDLNPELMKRFLSLAPTDEIEDENGGPLEMPSFFDPGVLEELSGNNALAQQGWKRSKEFLTHDWRIEGEHLDDWIAVINNFVNASDAAGIPPNKFNKDIERVPQLRIQSARFQCGLLVGRCTNWHLELRLVEHDHEWTKQKYLGIFLIMDEPVNWGHDELLPEFLYAAVNVQLRKHDDADGAATAVLIVASAKTEPLKFGLDPTCTQHACFSDFLPWEEFLSDYSWTQNGNENGLSACVTLRLRMDMFSGTSWLRRPKLHKQTKPTSVQVQDVGREVASEEGDPIIAGSLEEDDIEQRMRQLLISGDGADVTIYTSDKEVVKAHREILITRAPGMAIFINERSELHVNFGRDTIQILLEYIYTDKMRFPKQLTLNLANEVLAAGAVFHIRDLRHDVMECLATSMGMGAGDGNKDNQKDGRAKLNGPAIKDGSASTDTMKENSIDEKYFLDMKEFKNTAKIDRLKVRNELAKFFESRTPIIEQSSPTAYRLKNQPILNTEEIPSVSNPILGTSKTTFSKSKPSLVAVAPSGVHRRGSNSKYIGASTKVTGNTAASKTVPKTSTTGNKRSLHALHSRAWR